MYFLKDGQTEQGKETMDLFVKECGYDGGVHDNQTMWFEECTGRSHYANKEYRQALKEYWHVVWHAYNMHDDLQDYYGYAMRRFSLQAFTDMITFSDTTKWQNRTLSKTAIAILRLEHRISKVKDEELAKIDPEKEEWMKSEDYTKL
jgi:peptide alpha-N-acetyltransferase